MRTRQGKGFREFEHLRTRGGGFADVLSGCPLTSTKNKVQTRNCLKIKWFNNNITISVFYLYRYVSSIMLQICVKNESSSGIFQIEPFHVRILKNCTKNPINRLVFLWSGEIHSTIPNPKDPGITGDIIIHNLNRGRSRSLALTGTLLP